MSPQIPTVLMQSDDGAAWLRFAGPTRVLRADTAPEVLPALAAVDQAVAAGSWAAGFIAYDAAPAFDPVLAVHPAARGPLLWFGIFPPPERLPAGWAPRAPAPPHLDWRPSVTPAAHAAAVGDIRGCIARGETYQVNLTHRLRAAAPEDAFALFAAMANAQRGRHMAWVDTGDLLLASASPELFFSLDGT
ncbi:MAG: chorismate-binding protein, partial [Verrucomicrobia bacterium]|nr:chorismate-binding protein [Verrucomicrobiota bacterium]